MGNGQQLKTKVHAKENAPWGPIYVGPARTGQAAKGRRGPASRDDLLADQGLKRRRGVGRGGEPASSDSGEEMQQQQQREEDEDDGDMELHEAGGSGSSSSDEGDSDVVSEEGSDGEEEEEEEGDLGSDADLLLDEFGREEDDDDDDDDDDGGIKGGDDEDDEDDATGVDGDEGDDDDSSGDLMRDSDEDDGDDDGGDTGGEEDVDADGEDDSDGGDDVSGDEEDGNEQQDARRKSGSQAGPAAAADGASRFLEGSKGASFARAFSKLLKTKAAKAKAADEEEEEAPILSKSKSVSKRQAEEDAEAAAKREAKRARLERRRRGHLKVPRRVGAGGINEYASQAVCMTTRMARGVVMLFNAIATAQKQAKAAGAGGGGGGAAAKKPAKLSKASFLAQLRGTSNGSAAAAEGGGSGVLSGAAAAAAAKDGSTGGGAAATAPGWKVLQAGFSGVSGGGKMKDWDRKPGGSDEEDAKNMGLTAAAAFSSESDGEDGCWKQPNSEVEVRCSTHGKYDRNTEVDRGSRGTSPPESHCEIARLRFTAGGILTGTATGNCTAVQTNPTVTLFLLLYGRPAVGDRSEVAA
ncbi:hypothetical protein VOLCADRAFT_104806 [Volvox carteri f. nagariensis]|uniref:Uncharacterized protein n=1 Tax=Volvox carteri f. nagariensis TaxID=3068 RepID=D8TW80_VOLCA|nr:uncharacterized protein VOLCADRAFT_104806 [Volvox carteri f. nagariensis]EFJ48326.1 hypothetical protein VOLCADRAFT_104806 [Volvox carteri f. nagariensis]|eukprot:XP_002950580.1 hypothetical protein VOLCADRAFT_104806 [Volvox carteri f. nagariensis]